MGDYMGYLGGPSTITRLRKLSNLGLFCACLVAQTVKNPPAMRETWV